jgi:hypothetical protein
MWLRIGTITGCCEYGDEPSCCGATELISFRSSSCLADVTPLLAISINASKTVAYDVYHVP